MAYIPYGRQSISDDDIQAVVDVLKSDFLTQGPAVPAFEQALSLHCHAEHVLAVSNATAALHIACLSLDVGEGDVVWTSAITFTASANCARYCGAKVDFVDIDARTFNICVDALNLKLEQADKEGCLPKVLIVVHMCGQPCEMERIAQLAERYKFAVIEDASHAIGAQYKSQPTGNCEYSDITVFSFHPVKIITTGEGGAATTNNAELARKMRLLRSHAITRDSAEMVNESTDGWYYEQVGLGFNYRMTDMQAALGLSQFKRLSRFIATRHEIVSRYTQLLEGLPLELPWQHPDAYSSFHLYVIRLCLDKIRPLHKDVFQRLRDRNIGVNLHYIPVYLQPYYREQGFQPGYCPQAEAYYARAISIPMFPDLSEVDQSYVVQSLQEVMEL